MKYTSEMVVEISPCLLGFDVKTYWVKVYESGFTQGQGFKRDQGILTASTLINMLWHTEEPFQVRLK